VTVPWLRLLAGPVCDLTFVTVADGGGYAPQSAAGNSKDGKDYPSRLSLISHDNSADSLGRWVSGGEKLAWLICKTTVSLFLSPINFATKHNSIFVFS